MEQLLNKAVDLFQEPYDDRDERESSLPSLRAVADQMNTTILRVRKLLITAEYFSTGTSRMVQEMAAEGRTIAEIMDVTELSRASINSYLPYKNLAFNLDQTTVNADRHRVFRRRVKAVEELNTHAGFTDEMEYLWKAIIAFENYPFRTSGHGCREGVRFTYTVSRSSGTGGRHYNGAGVEGYGNEMWITTAEGEKKKSISRSTAELAVRNALAARGVVKGPKVLNVPGAHSYLYPILVRFGVISSPSTVD